MISTQNAKALYKAGKYEDAILVYRALEGLMGKGLFSANIKLCEKRLGVKRRNNDAERMSVAFIGDENFAMPTFVAIYSLIVNAKKPQAIDIYILSVGMSAASIAAIENLSSMGPSVKIIAIDENHSEYAILSKGFHVSTAAITKFSLPNLLPHLDKVLYLDGDIIVQEDLSGFYADSLDGSYAAVIKDIKPTLRYNPSMLDKLRIQDHRFYFNSGVMLLNLKAMRSDNIPEKLFDYRKNGINFFMDQDALNVVFGDKVNYVSCEYNLLCTLPESFSIAEIAHEYGLKGKFKDFGGLMRVAKVVHFASKEKPWKQYSSDHFNLWFRYYISSGAYQNKRFNILPDSLVEKIRGLVVSLTTYPPRINTVHQTIESIFAQTFKPNKVVLWLAKEEFPGGESDLPQSLLGLRSRGLTISWCNNTRSYKKLVPSLKAYPNDIIVTADDDILYESSWLEGLVASYIQYPDVIHCSRAHRVLVDEGSQFVSYGKWPREVKESAPGFNTFFTGCGGVLYPPGALHDDVVNEKKFMTLCRSGDDIWFWAMALLNGTKIRVVPASLFSLDFVPGSQDEALWKQNDVGGENDKMLRNVAENYPDVVKMLGR